MLFNKNHVLMPALIIVFIGMLAGSTQLSAKDRRPTVSVNIFLSDASLKVFADEFSKQTDVLFSYESSVGSKKLGDVRLNAENEPLDEVLEESISKEKGFNFKVVDKTVAVTWHEPVQSTQSTRAAARKIDVRGTVTDENGETIPGATIMIKGTNMGTVADANGYYVFPGVDEDAVLVFTTIGFVTSEIPVNGRAVINATLAEDVLKLSEVVVVGYNTVRRAQVTGAIETVKADRIADETSATLEDRLKGKVAGLLISSSSGAPGTEDFRIRIRGNGSINSSNTPLYILDGNMVPSAQFANLNSDDIADVQVLKDASATAIYGSRAANGVIVLTTKRGSPGKTTVTYNMKTGTQLLRPYPVEMMNSAQFLEWELLTVTQNPASKVFPMQQWLRIEQAVNNGTATASEIADWNAQGKQILADARATDTDWVKLMTQTGFTMEHSISVSGGDSKTRFFVSGSYMDQKGTLKGSTFTRYSGRLNLSHKINNVVSMGVNATIGYSHQHQQGDGGTRNSYQNAWFTAVLAYPYYDETWTSKDNPTWLTKYVSRNNDVLRLVGTAYVQLQFTDWLFFKTNLGMNHRSNQGFFTIHRDHPTQASLLGTMTQSLSNGDSYTWTNTLNFMKNFNKVHDLSAVVGYELYRNGSYSMSMTGYDIDPDMMESTAGIGDTSGTSANKPNISGSKTQNRLMSAFFQANYGYDNRYIGSVSLRYDNSSKFQGKNKGAMFYSVGFSWNVANEQFLKQYENIDQLRLRLSYGTTGNQDGINNFVTYAGWGKASYNGYSGYVMNSIGAPDLRWEKSAQAGVGVDFSMWNGRLKTTVDWYRKDTKDLIMSKSISRISGFSSISTNAGSIRNSGIEITLEGTPIKTKAFAMTIGGNFTYNKNQLTDLGTWANADGYYRSGSSWYQVGMPIGTWARREFGGIDPATGQVMFVKEDGTLTASSGQAPYKTLWSTYNPPYFGGFYTNFKLYGFSLGVNWNFAAGHYIQNGNRGYHDNLTFNGNKPVYILEGMWREPGQVGAEYPRINPANGSTNPGTNHQIEPGDYLRLKLAKLSYTFDRKRLQKVKFLSGVDLFVQGENLLTFTKYTGVEVETTGSSDNLAYPHPMTFTGGVNIRF
ncbi:MAG: TonB-dependent receptor [Bacteroidales bacterium]|nr:TonB-dependent receptor [Bacteroidales bacterium]